MLKETYTLRNGIKITYPALGTWQISDDTVETCVLDAIEVGYRHIDSAAAYLNEDGVGRALKKTKVDRGEIFITTKVPAEVKTYEGAKKSIETSLKKLGTYIDLVLIHAPRPWSEMGPNPKYNYYKENIEVWKALIKAYNDGLVKSIGVSNFSIEDIENIVKATNFVPHVNQIAIFIGCYPKDVIDYCQKNNILVEAYSPNATGRLKNNEKVQEIAKKYNVSVPQLGIRFDYQLGTLPLPKTTHKEYMVENANIEFEISKEDMEYLKTL